MICYVLTIKSIQYLEDAILMKMEKSTSRSFLMLLVEQVTKLYLIIAKCIKDGNKKGVN